MGLYFELLVSGNHMNTKEKSKRFYEILDTARDLFRKHGINNVSIDKIVATMNVAKGTVYNYFESRDEIYAHIILEFNHRLIESLQAFEQNEPVVPRLRHLIRGYTAAHLQDLAHTKIIFACKDALNWQNLTDQTKQKWRDYQSLKFGLTKSIIEQGIAENVFMNEDVTLLSEVGISMMEGVIKNLIQQAEESPSHPLDRLTSLAEDILVKGFRV